MLTDKPAPSWLTFDCYGTLIQWGEGLYEVARQLLHNKNVEDLDPRTLLEVYERHEYRLEQTPPYRSFREITGIALEQTMDELGLPVEQGDGELLTAAISGMPAFPEVPSVLQQLKAAGFRLCIISNTDDSIIADNVERLGNTIDRIITAEQAGAYKPSRALFEHAYRELCVDSNETVHICASPHLDLAAARDLGLRCIWVDRGTGRKPPPDYTPDATLPDLNGLPGLFAQFGWIAHSTT